jgi:hypothetical protein
MPIFLSVRLRRGHVAPYLFRSVIPGIHSAVKVSDHDRIKSPDAKFYDSTLLLPRHAMPLRRAPDSDMLIAPKISDSLYLQQALSFKFSCSRHFVYNC